MGGVVGKETSLPLGGSESPLSPGPPLPPPQQERGLYVLYPPICKKYELRGMWDLPGPGLKPVSPALEAGSVNHWTTREVPDLPCFHSYFARCVFLLGLSHVGFED